VYGFFSVPVIIAKTRKTRVPYKKPNGPAVSDGNKPATSSGSRRSDNAPFTPQNGTTTDANAGNQESDNPAPLSSHSKYDGYDSDVNNDIERERELDSESSVYESSFVDDDESEDEEKDEEKERDEEDEEEEETEQVGHIPSSNRDNDDNDEDDNGDAEFGEYGALVDEDYDLDIQFKGFERHVTESGAGDGESSSPLGALDAYLSSAAASLHLAPVQQLEGERSSTGSVSLKGDDTTLPRAEKRKGEDDDDEEEEMEHPAKKVKGAFLVT